MWTSKRISIWSPKSFISRSIDSYYVHGVSITYDESPRKHIWSYSVGRSENQLGASCPCNNGSTAYIPSFVGDDYYCESGNSGVNTVCFICR